MSMHLSCPPVYRMNNLQLVLIQFIAQNVLWSSHKSIKFWTFFKPNVSKLHGIIGWMSSIWAYLKNPWVVMALFGFEECIQNDRLAFSVSEREIETETYTHEHTHRDRQTDSTVNCKYTYSLAYFGRKHLLQYQVHR